MVLLGFTKGVREPNVEAVPETAGTLHSRDEWSD